MLMLQTVSAEGQSVTIHLNYLLNDSEKVMVGVDGFNPEIIRSDKKKNIISIKVIL